MEHFSTDPEVFKNTFEYMQSMESSNNGIDLDLGVSRGNEGVHIPDFVSAVQDEESSDEDRIEEEVLRHVREANGNYSNDNIEKLWGATSSNKDTEKPSKAKIPKEKFRGKWDELRETANRSSSSSLEESQPGPTEEERVEETAAAAQGPKSSKSRKTKFTRNAAIESIIKGAAAPAGDSSSAPQARTVNTNGTKPLGRGRGRGTELNRKNNMIRPECINGYNANPDYNPNVAFSKLSLNREDFPPL